MADLFGHFFTPGTAPEIRTTRLLCASAAGPETVDMFERFIEIGSAHPECRPLLEAYTKCDINPAHLRPKPHNSGCGVLPSCNAASD